MISDDVLALLQVDPPGIELCRICNMQNEGATNSHPHSSRKGGPRMDRLCTLLLPPLRQGPDGIGAISTAYWVEEQSRHQIFCEPWPECHRALLGRRQIFRPSTRDRVVNFLIEIMWCDLLWCSFDFVVRCDTLLSYADLVHVAPTVSVVSVGDDNANAEEDNENNLVLWDAWGPRATSIESSDGRHVRWRNCFAEQRVTIEEAQEDDLIRIHDYNSYRIRQARDSNVGLSQNGTHRIFGRREIQGGEWFEKSVTTELPYLDIVVNVQGCMQCTEIYLEQDEVLLMAEYPPPMQYVSGICCCHRSMMLQIAFS